MTKTTGNIYNYLKNDVINDDGSRYVYNNIAKNIDIPKHMKSHNEIGFRFDNKDKYGSLNEIISYKKDNEKGRIFNFTNNVDVNYLIRETSDSLSKKRENGEISFSDLQGEFVAIWDKKYHEIPEINYYSIKSDYDKKDITFTCLKTGQHDYTFSVETSAESYLCKFHDTKTNMYGCQDILRNLYTYHKINKNDENFDNLKDSLKEILNLRLSGRRFDQNSKYLEYKEAVEEKLLLKEKKTRSGELEIEQNEFVVYLNSVLKPEYINAEYYKEAWLKLQKKTAEGDGFAVPKLHAKNGRSEKYYMSQEGEKLIYDDIRLNDIIGKRFIFKTQNENTDVPKKGRGR